MIKYSLRCPHRHVFEAWFRNSDGYDEQRAEGAVSCPQCGSAEIEKAPMAPNVASSGGLAVSSSDEENFAAFRKAARDLRKEVEASCDYVGDKFAEEARKIHYGESDERPIYGEATVEEGRELHDEGIEIMVLPDVDKEDA